MINSPLVRQHNASTDFFRQWTCLSQLTMDFVVDEPQWLVLTGHLDVVHRNLINGVLGYAGKLSLISAPSLNNLPVTPSWYTPPGTTLEGSINSGNILDITQHYGKICWNAAKLLTPGAYRVLAHANSHSSINGNSTDGLAEVLVEGGKGLNILVATFHPPA